MAGEMEETPEITVAVAVVVMQANFELMGDFYSSQF